MPSLIDIRRRIRSVKNTQQITKAMKMVSAAKLRRAQERVMSARPYATIIERMLSNVAAAAADNEEAAANPLLAVREEKRILLLVVTADRGSAGAFNSNLIKSAVQFINDHKDAEIELELIGRKGRDFFRKRGSKIGGEYTGLFQKAPKLEEALEIARKVAKKFAEAEVDSVYIAVNEFKNVMSGTLTLKRILPVQIPSDQEKKDYIYEQPPEQLLGALLPRYIEVQIFRALIESMAAEHAARMTAMDSASKNAGEVIDKLTLYMNRVRQASITREIIEIVSGASALD